MFYFRLSNFYSGTSHSSARSRRISRCILKSLGFPAWQIGVLLAVNPVARIFGPNFWGWLSDHYGGAWPADSA